MCSSISRRAGLDAHAAEDAAQVVDLVDATVTLAGRILGAENVGGRLDVDGVGRAGPGAQLAPDALLQAVVVAVKLMTAMVARHHDGPDEGN